MKKLVALIFCAFFLLNKAPSFAQTGTCECGLNAGTRLWYVKDNYCASNEQPSGCEGSAIGNPSLPNCVCQAVPTSPVLLINTCTCNNLRVVTGSNCQGSTPRASCGNAYSGYVDCSCSPALSTTPPPHYTQPASYLCSDGLSVDTALGCIPVKMDKFIAWLLPYLFGIGGGIAFLLMVYGFILITTSKGDPKAVQAARETITSAVIGLLVSIFAIFILRLITLDILKIPGIS